MDAFHRQKRQQCGRSQHREHVSEVGGSSHLDIFDHVGIGLAPFNDPLLQNHQILFQKDDVRGLFGDIHGGIHRDADICRFHGGGVIDAVSHKADRMSVAAQRGYDAGLLIRGKLGEYIGGFRSLYQFIITHALHVGTEEQISHFHAHLFADTAGHAVVVSGKNLCGYAVLLQGAERISGRFFRRIQEGQVSHQYHLAFVPDTVCIHGGKGFFLGNCNDTHAVFIQRIDGGHDFLADIIRKRLYLLFILCKRADRKHFIHGPLCDHLPFSVFILNDCGQTAA